MIYRCRLSQISWSGLPSFTLQAARSSEAKHRVVRRQEEDDDEKDKKNEKEDLQGAVKTPVDQRATEVRSIDRPTSLILTSFVVLVRPVKLT